MATADELIQQLVGHIQGLKQPSHGAAGAIGGGIGALINGNNVADAYSTAGADAESQANSLKTQMDNMPTLAAMYGQDSPYALQMQRQLAAADAKAGRNSQYGPRMQQLQANLADKSSQYLQQQANMANMYNTARSNANQQKINAATGQAQVRGQQLGSLFNVGQQTGILPTLNQGIADYAAKGLGNMFNFGGGNEPGIQQPMVDSPYSGGGDYSGYTTGGGDNYQGYDTGGAVNQPMDQSPYANYGGNYQDYTTGSDSNPMPYNAPSGTDIYDDY
jgi:hypothetical protein